MKKSAFMKLCVVLASLFIASTASAARYGYYTCNVKYKNQYYPHDIKTLEIPLHTSVRSSANDICEDERYSYRNRRDVGHNYRAVSQWVSRKGNSSRYYRDWDNDRRYVDHRHSERRHAYGSWRCEIFKTRYYRGAPCQHLVGTYFYEASNSLANVKAACIRKMESRLSYGHRNWEVNRASKNRCR